MTPPRQSVYDRSGEPRKIRLKAWALIREDGLLCYSLTNIPCLFSNKRLAKDMYITAEKPVRVTVTIEAVR